MRRCEMWNSPHTISFYSEKVSVEWLPTGEGDNVKLTVRYSPEVADVLFVSNPAGGAFVVMQGLDEPMVDRWLKPDGLPWAVCIADCTSTLGFAKRVVRSVARFYARYATGANLARLLRFSPEKYDLFVSLIEEEENEQLV